MAPAHLAAEPSLEEIFDLVESWEPVIGDQSAVDLIGAEREARDRQIEDVTGSG